MILTQPIQVGSVTLKNRLMFPPLTTGYEGRDGSITKQSIAFYERLAKGGTGYIVIGDVNPVPGFSPTPRLHQDELIESFRSLTDVVHAHGTKIAAQIFYPEYDVEALASMAAQGDFAAVREKLHYDMEHFTSQVTEEQLMEICQKIVDCAVRVQKAGFDLIQIHGDRLLGTLCSTKMNHRTDRFGGSLENRTRFARMVVGAIRKALPDFPIDYKLAVVTKERGRGGIDQEDAPQFAKWLEKDGVSMLHVAQANHTGNLADTIPPMGVQPYGFFVQIARQVKEAVTIPVSTVGRILDPEMAEHILQSGSADLIGVGRPLLCDPDWGVKLLSGKPETIRRCISCNKGCTDAIQNRSAIHCVLNAENGRESEVRITPAAAAKKVAVIGGGPAGLEAARVAARRGHSVDLYEKRSRLGGQLNLACVPPRKAELNRAVTDLEAAAVREGVRIHMGQSMDENGLLREKPDAVILAVGALSFTPSIPGADGILVKDAWAVLSGDEIAYGRVVVIGGGLVGCETAEFLAENGADVTIVEMLPTIAQGESNTVMPTLLENFNRHGVKTYTDTTVKQITPTSVVCGCQNGEELILPCDTVVMAAGAKPVPFETEKLERAGIDVIRIGDCDRSASDISNAIKSAYDGACGL